MLTDRHMPISAEAQGQLRLLYARIGADAERVEAAARRVPSNTGCSREDSIFAGPLRSFA